MHTYVVLAHLTRQGASNGSKFHFVLLIAGALIHGGMQVVGTSNGPFQVDNALNSAVADRCGC